MDATTKVELNQRVIATVLKAAERASGKDVDEELDLIAAGADSIAVMRMASELKAELGVDCTMEDIFDQAPLGALATVLAQRIESHGLGR
jgi:aryl carrier-like protein